VHGTTDNVEAASKARIVVIAVPPGQASELVGEIAGHLIDGAVVASLADGITLADLGRYLPGGAAIKRIAELDQRAVRAAFVAALTRAL